MKKILIALLFAVTGQMSAIAQNTESRVCTASSKNGVSCYKTRYAENFKVCPTNRGYTICGETPTNTKRHPPKQGTTKRLERVKNVSIIKMVEHLK